MATYLITGIAGFIGSSLARAILAQGDKVRGIDNFSTGLEKLGTGGFTSIASLTSNPASFDDLLAPGSYRFAIAGTGSGFFGGIYRGTLHVAAVPEADTWVMLLMAFGIVVYQLRRKQRSLEQPPAAALIA